MDGSTPVGSLYLPERPIWDQPTTGHESEEWIDLLQGPLAQPAAVIGPKATTADDGDLRLLTRGIAKVEVGDDAPSANFLPGPGIVPGQPFPGAAYTFPVGLDEAVEEDEFWVDAVPLTSDSEFQCSLSMNVTVTYE